MKKSLVILIVISMLVMIGCDKKNSSNDGIELKAGLVLITNESTDLTTEQEMGDTEKYEVRQERKRVYDYSSLPFSAKKIDKIFDIPDNLENVPCVPKDMKRGVKGDTKKFWTFDKNDNNIQINATLRYVGSKCEVWVENSENMTDDQAKKVADKFDTDLSVIVESNFGNTSDVDGDGRIKILMYDIADNYETTGSYIAGYFYALDLYQYDPDYPQYKTNETEVINIDTYPALKRKNTDSMTIEYAYSTIVHEYQHMVNFNENVVIENNWNPANHMMPIWLNEGMSMAAEQIYDPNEMYGRIAYYNFSQSIRDGVSAISWNNSTVMENYSLAYLLVQYLRTQSGQGNAIYKEIMNDKKNTYLAFENIIKKYVNKNLDMGSFMTNFRKAMVLKEKTGIYGFMGEEIFNYLDTGYYYGNGTLNGGGAVLKYLQKGYKVNGQGENIRYTQIDLPADTVYPTKVSNVSYEVNTEDKNIKIKWDKGDNAKQYGIYAVKKGDSEIDKNLVSFTSNNYVTLTFERLVIYKTTSKDYSMKAFVESVNTAGRSEMTPIEITFSE